MKSPQNVCSRFQCNLPKRLRRDELRRGADPPRRLHSGKTPGCQCRAQTHPVALIRADNYLRTCSFGPGLALFVLRINASLAQVVLQCVKGCFQVNWQCLARDCTESTYCDRNLQNRARTAPLLRLCCRRQLTKRWIRYLNLCGRVPGVKGGTVWCIKKVLNKL